MDVDATEIQIWTRQADGTHQMRWLPLRELMKLMKQTALDTLDDLATALAAASPPEHSPEALPAPPE
jgi:hypothetical protein